MESATIMPTESLKKTLVASVTFQRVSDPTVRVRAQDDKQYEYILPDGATGKETHGVVFVDGGTGLHAAHVSGLRIVTIKEVKELGDVYYNGDLKLMAAAFDIGVFNDHISKHAKKVALMGRIDKILAESTKVEQLRAAAANNPAAKELLEQLEKLG
jgi:hypothetical protein